MSAQAPSGRNSTGLLSRDQAKTLADRVLALSRAEQTRVNITSEWTGNTRFADAGITTSGGVADLQVTVTATIGRRRASASTNVLDDASLKRTVDLAAQLARLSPEDPELMPELGPQTYAPVDAFMERTAQLNGERRAEAVKRVVEAAVEAGKPAGDIFVAGFLDVHARTVAVANTSGLFAYHRSTSVKPTAQPLSSLQTSSSDGLAGLVYHQFR